MSQTVFILGAGASRKAGAPLMQNFLDVSEQLRDGNQVSESLAQFNLVFAALAALSQTHSKATLDIMNIESVFAAFEMAKLLGRLGTLTVQEIDQLSDAMSRVIVRTLEKTIKIPLKEGRARAPEPYSRLVELIAKTFEVGSGRINLPKRFSIITFNYDLCLDLAFYAGGIHVRYSLADDERKDAIAVLKLHGSLNWGHCSSCGKLVAWPLPQYFQARNWAYAESDHGTMEMSLHMKEFQDCKSGTFTGPYVVPPTWNKGQYHNSLESVWKAAASELSTAENIFVSGYSLPESDQFFRYLYALGTVGDLRLKNLWVFDPSSEVEARFRALLGQAAAPRFTFFQAKFEDMFAQVRSVI
jgi:hypothetical protein